MGKGNILSNLGNGKYEVEVVYNTEKLDSAIEKLEKEINRISSDVLPELEQKETETLSEVQQAEFDLKQAIEAYVNYKTPENKEEVDKYQQKYLDALNAYQKASMEYNDKKMELESLKKRKDFLQDNYPENEIKEMWCADYTNNLSGEVGTVEIPGSMQYMQIRPGYDGKASFDSSRDGQLYPTVALPPAGAFYNLAMLPGWQKWRPQYRLGTIQNIDKEKNTGDVILNNEDSKSQNLDVNQSSSLSNVPIEYMSCDSGAFADGDKVLVEFEGRKWENVKVVGFESEPKECATYVELLVNDLVCNLDTWTLSVYKNAGDGTKGTFLMSFAAGSDRGNESGLFKLNSEAGKEETLVFELLWDNGPNDDYFFYSRADQSSFQSVTWDTVYRKDAVYGTTTSLDNVNYDDYASFESNIIKVKNVSDTTSVDKGGDTYQAIKLDYKRFSLILEEYSIPVNINDPAACCSDGWIAGTGTPTLENTYHVNSGSWGEVSFGYTRSTYWGTSRPLTAAEAEQFNNDCDSDFASAGDPLSATVRDRSYFNSMMSASDIFGSDTSSDTFDINAALYVGQILLDGELWTCCSFVCQDWTSGQDSIGTASRIRLKWIRDFVEDSEIHA